MANHTDPHFVVVSVIESLGGLPYVMAKRLDDNDLLIRYGVMLNGVRIETGEIVRALNEVGEGRDDVWGFSLNSVDDLRNFTIGQTVALQQTIPIEK
jgi:hypothetical protein